MTERRGRGLLEVALGLAGGRSVVRARRRLPGSPNSLVGAGWRAVDEQGARKLLSLKIMKQNGKKIRVAKCLIYSGEVIGRRGELRCLRWRRLRSGRWLQCPQYRVDWHHNLFLLNPHELFSRLPE